MCWTDLGLCWSVVGLCWKVLGLYSRVHCARVQYPLVRVVNCPPSEQGVVGVVGRQKKAVEVA